MGPLLLGFPRVKKGPRKQRGKWSLRSIVPREILSLRDSKTRQTGTCQSNMGPPLSTGHLCCPCSWDWTFFQRNCYFFSNSKLNWSASVTACQKMGAQLVVIKDPEEQVPWRVLLLLWVMDLTADQVRRR